jgi:hypothetical protein
MRIDRRLIHVKYRVSLRCDHPASVDPDDHTRFPDGA